MARLGTAAAPTVGILLYLPGAVWSFLAEFGAERQTLGLSTPASIAAMLIAGVVSTPIQWLIIYAISSAGGR